MATGKKNVMQFTGVRVAGTGSYLPERVVTNASIIKEFGLSMTDEQIFAIIGARERRAAAPGERCSDMAYQASLKALESAGIGPSELDMIMVSAVPGDGVTPETASVLRGLLEAPCPAFDVRMACVGWVAALQIAMFHLCYGGLRRILIAAATHLSWQKNWGNPLHRTIFGDAAAAVVVERDENSTAPWYIRLWTGASEEEGRNTIYFKGPWSTYPPIIPQGWAGDFHMADRHLYFDALTKYVPPVMKEIWDASGCRPVDINAAIIHWPSRDLHLKSIEVTGVPLGSVLPTCAEDVGNIIAAEIPFTLDQSIRSNRIQRKQLVFAFTYGSGLTGGFVLFRY